MPRKARLDVPGTLHHVMVRGIDGINIFRDEGDRKAFVDRMRSLVKETGTRILAWAFMDTHTHFLVISGPAGLPTFMRRLLIGYAIGFNLAGSGSIYFKTDIIPIKPGEWSEYDKGNPILMIIVS